MDLDKIEQGLKNDQKRLKKQAQNEDMYSKFRNTDIGSDTLPDDEGIPSVERIPEDYEEFEVPVHEPTEEDIEYGEQSTQTPKEYDEAIFPGGPYISEIQSWKKQYEDAGNRVLVTEIDDTVFVFRTLNRHEYKQVVAMPNTNPLQREEIFCKTCVLWPILDWQSMAAGRAGLPSTLAQIIMENSGFTKEYSVQVL